MIFLLGLLHIVFILKIKANPSQLPNPYRNRSIFLNSDTIKDILKQSPNKKQYSNCEGQQRDTKYGTQYTKNICLQMILPLGKIYLFII
ncbi:unnamed protein product [Paramecium sonneborni]|uniref:Uncharacterized protein n=1 Tax=Paramecium sonneborni TaxID=65129 RepID=A0A8S1RU82_9CILI|nr:unnamed protein product [Paramecium sonneborni]